MFSKIEGVNKYVVIEATTKGADRELLVFVFCDNVLWYFPSFHKHLLLNGIGPSVVARSNV